MKFKYLTDFLLKILAKREPTSEISIVSNKITFRTFDEPSIQLLNADYSNVTVEFKFKCKIDSNDSSIPVYQITKQLDQISLCHAYSYDLKNATQHVINTNSFIVFEKHFRNKPKLTVEDMVYMINMSFRLDEDANYSLKFGVRYYLNSDTFVLNSSTLYFTTTSSKLIKIPKCKIFIIFGFF